MHVDRIEALITESERTIAALHGVVEDIAAAGLAIVATLKAGGKVLTAGNGGSAAEALHMAEEIVGRYKSDRMSLPSVSLVADSTAITCIGNDFGFDEIFARQVEGLGNKGDALVLLSTSGNAGNLARALEVARSRDVTTVCLLGRNGGVIAGTADHEIVVAGTTTERIQEAHQVIVHLILEMIEQAYTDAGS